MHTFAPLFEKVNNLRSDAVVCWGGFLRFKRLSYQSGIITNPTKENRTGAKFALNNWLLHTQMLKIIKHTKYFVKCLHISKIVCIFAT